MITASKPLFDDRLCPDAVSRPATALAEVEAVIVDGYIPPFAKDDDRKPMVVVVCGEWKLRYSKGPHTGTFWDTYGDDFHSVELARVELAKAPPVPNGTPYVSFTFDTVDGWKVDDDQPS